MMPSQNRSTKTVSAAAGAAGAGTVAGRDSVVATTAPLLGRGLAAEPTRPRARRPGVTISSGRSRRQEDGMARRGVSASAEIGAPLDEVWAVVQDVLSAPEWQGGLVGITALETDAEGRATLVESGNDIKVRTVKTRVRFAYDGPTTLSWKQEKGDLKSVEGSWTLEDLGGDRTRATYTLDADPGRVLGMVIRGPVESAVRSMLVNARPGELKERVEGG